ncbi:MAG TPA: DEAD/DEAH box helicase [Acidimicrobiales bacterium]|nr:DEAD/DEAH box helicase [Acidimicrobiales bacterium]
MPPPTFADLGVPTSLTAVLTAQGVTEPFAIQAAALPDAMAGHDICGRAPTGSGKTLAFGLPLIAALARGDRWSEPRRPRGLVLVPTRELAAQVERSIAPLAAAVGARTATVFGGVSYVKQRAALRRGVDVLVACPGRLEDLVAQGDVTLGDTDLVVIDEADRMADMGFLPAVRRLLDRTAAKRQTMLFSATLDGEVDVLVRRYQTSPRRHEVEPDSSSNGAVHHVFWRAEQSDRLSLTAQIVAAHSPAMVFCRTRHGADRLTARLGAAGVVAAPIHGSRSQPQRQRALAAFTAGNVQALVATDVAARGIHVDDVACVVHYDPPADAKDYIHRSGRTGRAGADGIVVTMVGGDQAKAVRTMQRALGLDQRVSAPDPSALPPTAPPERRAPAPGAPGSETIHHNPRGGAPPSHRRPRAGQPARRAGQPTKHGGQPARRDRGGPPSPGQRSRPRP